MIYDYLLVLFRLIIGFLSSKTLIILALGGFGLYVVWICFAVLFSFGRKFNKRCTKLTAFVKSNEKSDENLSAIHEKAKSISSGLAQEIDSYKKVRIGYPSNYIKRSNSLDIEVSGGIFNHGKSLMKAYIFITSILLFIFNFAFLGADKVLTVSILTESLVLPVIYFIIMRVFYFIYTSTQQQLYRIDI